LALSKYCIQLWIYPVHSICSGNFRRNSLVLAFCVPCNNCPLFCSSMTGNYYGMVFYGCTVWFDKLKTMYKAKLMSAHFRLLRTACKDYNVQLSKSELTQRCERANPFQWVNFLTASKVVKITRDKQPVHLYNCITFINTL